MPAQLALDAYRQLDGDIEAKVRQAFANIRRGSEAAGLDIGHIVKFGTCATDLAHLATVRRFATSS